MPARRRSQAVDRCEIVIESDRVVSQHLCHTYWDMCKETNKEVMCAICLDSWLDCKRCAVLLRCGHCYHSSCLLANDDDRCAVCRE
jgi:hypothetical protein